MQTAVSIHVSSTEMHQWQYTPKRHFEDIQTPSINGVLYRLGEFGQTAQASILQAEQMLALPDPETNLLLKGNAGPELLVCVLLQNFLDNFLDKVKSPHVVQLYQHRTAKLVSRFHVHLIHMVRT